MSARERNRYATTVVVFLLAFGLVGFLLARSMRAFAQDFTFRPTVATSNTYGSGIPGTERLAFAFDPNLNTAAVTYTNSDFGNNGIGTPDSGFTWSGRWSAFNQTAFFLENVGLYVVRSATNNVANQWEIQYTLSGPLAGDASWFTLDDQAISGLNPSKGTIGTPPAFLPDDLDLQSDLAVRTRSWNQTSDKSARLNMFDIRVEAEWNTTTGGSEPLRITTTSLPDANVYVAYDEYVDAVGGNKPYTWAIVSGSLPSQFNWSEPGAPGYPMNITYSGTSPFTSPGDYDFIVEATDSSLVNPQTDQKSLSIHVAGLAISPQGPNLPIATKGEQYLERFEPRGGASPYYWCRTGSIPPGMSLLLDGVSGNLVPACPAAGIPDTTAAYQAGYVTLEGTPTNDGVYAFTLKLRDSGGEDIAVHDYQLEVRASGVTLLPKILKDYLKGVTYGGAGMSAEFIVATMIDTVGVAAGDIYVLPHTTPSDPNLPAPLDTLYLNPGGDGALLSTYEGAVRINIEGSVDMTVAARNYPFSVGIVDPDNAVGATDMETYTLRILERKTILLSSPSSTPVLPSDRKLKFLVFGEGGAPGDTSVDPNSTPYYDYLWQVTPVGDSPALDTASGGPVPASPAPAAHEVQIEFTSGGEPATGTYVVTFWAQDVLRRNNSTDDNYLFTPATVRLKVIPSGGQTLEKDTTRPTKLRQEQFR